MLYTVGEIAKKLNVAPSTLRYYDKEGLLPCVERSSSGTRMFSDQDYEWLRMIGCLKRSGMSIKDIKRFTDWYMEGDSTIGCRLELIRKLEEETVRKLRQLEDTLSILAYKRWYYETAEEAGTCDIHKERAEEEIPEPFREGWRKVKGLEAEAGGR